MIILSLKEVKSIFADIGKELHQDALDEVQTSVSIALEMVSYRLLNIDWSIIEGNDKEEKTDALRG